MRGVEIVATPLTSISKISATGDDPRVFDGYCGAESGFVPVSTVAVPSGWTWTVPFSFGPPASPPGRNRRRAPDGGGREEEEAVAGEDAGDNEAAAGLRLHDLARVRNEASRS